MNNVVVCYKWVIEEQDISVDSGGNITMRNPSYKVSQYDRNAVEAAMQVAEAVGVECCALTAGDERVEKSRKEVLCAGPHAGYAVVDGALADADALATANALSAAIKKIGQASIIFCGEGSGDEYAQQVGPRIAAALGYPFVGYVTSVSVDGDVVHLERECSDGMEKLEAAMPVVISVAGDSNVPRLAGFKEILNAGKKPWETYTLADLGVEAAEGFVRAEMTGNLPDRKHVVISGSSEEIAAEIVKNLIAEGVLG